MRTVELEAENRYETPKSVQVVSVIRVVAVRGLGTREDPVRTVVQYWSTDREELLAEKDGEVHA